MYLITIEGGDGSGKGIATKMLEEILIEEFSFFGIWVTGEPRRDHPLGQLAVEAVRTGEAGPVREASLFAADRLDHSHAWIMPRLKKGMAVLSERNVHSSLVYQGIVGDIGLEETAKLNSASCVPDLCIWVDCDPEMALRRITHGTLREATMDKQEYFETDELQIKIRAGYASLLGGELPIPEPFNKGAVVGPILNDGTKKDLRKKLQKAVRAFLHRRPTPLNVTTEEVESLLLEKAMHGERGQTTLDVLEQAPQRSSKDWLNGETPWKALKEAYTLYGEAHESIEHERKMDVPSNPLHHTVLSVVGTLSLLPGAEVTSLRKWLGPVRMVSGRHTQRMLKFLHEQSGWVRTHKSLRGKDAPRSELRADWQAFGRLGIVIWPLKEELSEWASENPNGRWRDAVSAIIEKSSNEKIGPKLEACVARLNVIGSGISDIEPPATKDDFRKWWRNGPEN
mgnify:CR=1 FL=1